MAAHDGAAARGDPEQSRRDHRGRGGQHRPDDGAGKRQTDEIRARRGQPRVETFTFAADAARSLHGETIPLDAAKGGVGKIGYYMRVPVGVIAAITPFNFPLNLVAHKVAPAVAAGCPIVLKPNRPRR